MPLLNKIVNDQNVRRTATLLDPTLTTGRKYGMLIKVGKSRVMNI